MAGATGSGGWWVTHEVGGRGLAGGGDTAPPRMAEQVSGLATSPTSPASPGEERRFPAVPCVCGTRKARAVLPPGGLRGREGSGHRRSPQPTGRPAPCQPVQPARDTPCPVLGFGFPAGQGHAPPTREPSPGPRWPRCGSGSQPWRPRPPPPTAPPVPSPSSPWLPAGSGERVRARRRPSLAPAPPPNSRFLPRSPPSLAQPRPPRCIRLPWDTHPHVEHVQRHGLFGQQLHGGIRVHGDGAAAH